METLLQIIEAFEKLAAWFPFLAASGLFSIIASILGQIFSKERALKRGPWQGFWWRGRQFLPLYAPIAGLLFGAYVDPAGGPAMYCFAGIVSVFAFDLLKRFAGWAPKLPGSSLPPEE